jgi:hypothetical protein
LGFPVHSAYIDFGAVVVGLGVRYTTVNCSSGGLLSRAVRRGLPVRDPAGLSGASALSS